MTSHLVLGASGAAGSALIGALVDAGAEVRGLTRSGRAPGAGPVRIDACDITVPGALDRWLRGVDVVHMAAQPAYHRWPQEFPTMLRSVLDSVGGSGARLVMVDNLYAYGRVTGPMREGDPQRASDAKGRTRAAMADMLLAAQADGLAQVVIGRASDYLGPGCRNSGIMALAVAPAAGTGALKWLGRLDVAHSVAYLPDVARALVALGSAGSDVTGRIWHLPHEPAVTGHQLLGMVDACLPQPRRHARISTATLALAAPVNRVARESLAIRHQWIEPWVVADSAFRARFPDLRTTMLPQAVAASVAWARGQQSRAVPAT